MKRLLFLLVCVSCIGFSNERFISESSKTDELFSNLDKLMEDIHSEILDLKKNQNVLIDLLIDVLLISKPNEEDSWKYSQTAAD